jgi:hypothetical protein
VDSASVEVFVTGFVSAWIREVKGLEVCASWCSGEWNDIADVAHAR